MGFLLIFLLAVCFDSTWISVESFFLAVSLGEMTTEEKLASSMGDDGLEQIMDVLFDGGGNLVGSLSSSSIIIVSTFFWAPTDSGVILCSLWRVPREIGVTASIDTSTAM